MTNYNSIFIRLYTCNSRVIITLTCLLLLLLFSGCHKDLFSDDEDCQFVMSLSTNAQLDMQTATTNEMPLTAPDINQFKIQVLNPGGKVLKEWEHYSQVSNPIKSQVGSFMLKASHGEQHTGAFNQPYFEGSTNYGIRVGKQTEVSVVCYLANVMVSTSYTDKFKEFFADYSVSIASSGEPLLFTSADTSAGFFEPGQLSVIVNVTKQDGTSFSFPAAQIAQTKAREFYRFKLDFVGSAGSEKIQISFDASTIDTPISIDLSQEWISGSLPAYINTGFTNGEQFSNMEGEESPNQISTLISVPSRIKSCILSTTSDAMMQAGWPAKEIDLATADADTKAKLREWGLVWTERLAGLNMAQINFTGLVPRLPGGGEADITHAISVKTVDSWGQTTEQPLTVSFVTASPSFILQPHDDVWVRTEEMNFNLSMTRGRVEQINLEYNDGSSNTWTRLASITSPLSANNYMLKSAMNFTSPNAKIRAIYGSGKTSMIEFNVKNPTFDIATFGLPWAKHISLNLSEIEGEFLYNHFDKIKEELKVQVRTIGGEWEEIGFKITQGASSTEPIRFNIKGLESNTQQEVRVVYNGGIGNAVSNNSIGFTTEKELQVPNSDFETWTSTTISNVSQGGRQVNKPYIGSETWSDAPMVALVVHEPGGIERSWTTLNGMTADPSSTPLNTWYVVPSTVRNANAYSGSYAACIRSVGWQNSGGTVPPNTSKRGSSTGTPNAPNTLKRTAGMLFLGSYSNTVNEGISFDARPIGLKFYYKYIPKPKSDDKGLVRISVKAEDGSIIASTEEDISSQSDFKGAFINLNYSVFTKKATTLHISFVSSKATTVETTNDMTNFLSIGSELYIDDLELVYE